MLLDGLQSQMQRQADAKHKPQEEDLNVIHSDIMAEARYTCTMQTTATKVGAREMPVAQGHTHITLYNAVKQQNHMTPELMQMPGLTRWRLDSMCLELLNPPAKNHKVDRLGIRDCQKCK
jgi:hypothetical protein